VPGKIFEELQQTKPFRFIEEEAFLNIHRTANMLMQELVSLLKPYGLSETQYNVLRILRGAGERGLACKDISSRMITREPDITRLLDRLQKRSLVQRTRSREDRRFASVEITEQGLQILAELDEPVQQLQVALLGHLGPKHLSDLIHDLETVRRTLEVLT